MSDREESHALCSWVGIVCNETMGMSPTLITFHFHWSVHQRQCNTWEPLRPIAFLISRRPSQSVMSLSHSKVVATSRAVNFATFEGRCSSSYHIPVFTDSILLCSWHNLASCEALLALRCFTQRQLIALFLHVCLPWLMNRVCVFSLHVCLHRRRLPIPTSSVSRVVLRIFPIAGNQMVCFAFV